MNYKIAIVPYLGLNGKFNIGDYTIWNYKMYKDEIISCDNVKKQIDGIVSRYIDYKLAIPLEEVKNETVCVITPLNYQTQEFSYTDSDISNVRDIIFATFFYHMINVDNAFVSSDAFKFEIYNFNDKSRGISFHGKMFSKIDYVKFVTPYEVSNYFYKSFDNIFLTYVGEAIKLKIDNRVGKVFRALELYFHASSVSQMVTNESRILNLLMAFDTLLKIKSKDDFAYKIDKLLNIREKKIETREIHVKGKKTQVEFTLTSWWCYDLYVLRNNIIHCNSVIWDFDKYGDITNYLKFGGKILMHIIIKAFEETMIVDKSSNDELLLIGFLLDYNLDEMLMKFANSGDD